jgi:hypothetical protein
MGHEIKFEEAHRLIRMNTYMDKIVKDAIEIQLHAKNFNKESGFILSCTWQPVTSLLKQSPQPGMDGPSQGH